MFCLFVYIFKEKHQWLNKTGQLGTSPSTPGNFSARQPQMDMQSNQEIAHPKTTHFPENDECRDINNHREFNKTSQPFNSSEK